MSTTLSLAEVKAHLSELVGRVNVYHERITVTVHGRPSAVLVATEDLDALEETVAILSDAEAMRRLSLDPPNHIPELLSPVWTVPWVMWRRRAAGLSGISTVVLGCAAEGWVVRWRRGLVGRSRR